MKRYVLAFLCFALLTLSQAPIATAQELPPSIQAIRSVGSEGKNNPAATAAWAELAKSDAAMLTTILRGMDEANPLARNYLRAAFDTIAQRELDEGRQLPLEQLQSFLDDLTNDPQARRMAFEWIVRVKSDVKQRMLSEMLNDPSLEIRYDAVAQSLERCIALKETDKAAAIRAYEVTLSAARDQEHVKEAAAALRELGQTVDLPVVFGLIVDWKVIGPFDNAGGIGFAAEYPPEQEIDLAGKYKGKDGTVSWIDHTTADEYGMVDLNKALAKHMGAVGYAYHEFQSPDEREAELRLGCINANKVWLNGELLIANEVYHAGSRLDQYLGKGRLQKGKNTILVKVCQNEQTEDWAQVWEFQLRVCDALGTAILSQTRPVKLSANNSLETEQAVVTTKANR